MSLDRLTNVDSLYSITKRERKIIAEKESSSEDKDKAILCYLYPASGKYYGLSI